MTSIPSTNDYLKERLANSTPVPEGTVIMAVDQSAGRGQQGARWESSAGLNLTCSLLLTPHFLAPMDQFSLTVAVSLGMANFLSTLVDPSLISIKWPNDLFVQSRKIGGLLIENSVQGTQWKHAVVGIGLNVNQRDFSEEFRERATSLLLEGIQNLDPPSLLPALCHCLEEEYELLKNGAAAEQAVRYRDKLYRLGEESPFLIDGVPVSGTIRGVGPQGRLKVEFEEYTADFGVREIAFVH